ncbi:hypothetical protein PV10_00410 [Exophiala mesophila]|uniref:BTB domain-containing protein n=1 Tax=Exophiala mesophila TaxID=212818 RepID=A0A0D1Y799_EXOME|nr:uncharacterized protein PV10_00410 [Exophiala mesophila]KIV96561.1 hypothetical protein PV10_00410 [Exophiala mesophila]
MSGHPNNDAYTGFAGEGDRNIGNPNDLNQPLHFASEPPIRFVNGMPQPPVGEDFDRELVIVDQIRANDFFNQASNNVMQADDVFRNDPLRTLFDFDVLYPGVQPPKRPAEPIPEQRVVRQRLEAPQPQPEFHPRPVFRVEAQLPRQNAQVLANVPVPANGPRGLSVAECFKTPLVTLLVGHDGTRIQAHKGFLDKCAYFRKKFAETTSANNSHTELKLEDETPEGIYTVLSWLYVGTYEAKAADRRDTIAYRNYLSGVISDYGLASMYDLPDIRTQILAKNKDIQDVSWAHLTMANDRRLRGTRLWRCMMLSIRGETVSGARNIEHLLGDALADTAAGSDEHEVKSEGGGPELDMFTF